MLSHSPVHDGHLYYIMIMVHPDIQSPCTKLVSRHSAILKHFFDKKRCRTFLVLNILDSVIMMISWDFFFLASAYFHIPEKLTSCGTRIPFKHLPSFEGFAFEVKCHIPFPFRMNGFILRS